VEGTEIPQTNMNANCSDDLTEKDVPSLVNKLSNPDAFIRTDARDALSCIGPPALPELLNAMANANTQLRWQIIKIFDCIQDPSTIPILMNHLKNESAEIRWAASNALINFRREVIPPLLDGLTHDFGSLWFRQSAHHILRVLSNNGLLTPAERQVYQALDDIEPSVSVPWAAVKALQALHNNKNNLLQ